MLSRQTEHDSRIWECLRGGEPMADRIGQCAQRRFAMSRPMLRVRESRTPGLQDSSQVCQGLEDPRTRRLKALVVPCRLIHRAHKPLVPQQASLSRFCVCVCGADGGRDEVGGQPLDRAERADGCSPYQRLGASRCDSMRGGLNRRESWKLSIAPLCAGDGNNV
jgi:hypothetical protein